MGGSGHGHAHTHGNHHNLKESDEQMLGKIQRIETIKHYPNHWHMDPFASANISLILGGTPTFAYGALGAFFSVMYYRNQAVHMPYNFYANNTRTAGRLLFGLSIGLFVGYL